MATPFTPTLHSTLSALAVAGMALLFAAAATMLCMFIAFQRQAAKNELDRKALRQRQLAEQQHHFDRLPTSEQE
jgi:hypothetical protein